ncbi:MAG: valine--tRNA ligase [Nitrospirae bacterium]|nr:valine--tRNA ligase [Nitrospirota bacterium]
MEIKQNYQPEEIEDKWYALWESRGYFKPAPGAGNAAFSIVIPPPNVTGSLHMGHALNATVQDILARWKRMWGYSVLWVPGTDHAGIATQNVVERELAKEGLNRYELGRDAFIERIWQWKSEYGGKIIHQLKKLGASCDWSRERFTLDEGLSRAVREVFVRLFDEGLVYRDNRLINWCPRCHTALSDLEVEYEDIDGTLYYIKYPLAPPSSSSAVGGAKAGYVTVATTRPETMLGDTAVAVNPEDDRYLKLIGKTVELPFTGRKIPIIADPAVESAFGTGAVKVTPAHDFNDEAMGKRHGLLSISVIAEDGRMTAEAGEECRGLDRYECRKKLVSDLKDRGLLEGEKKHRHAVGHCYRCKTVIEPLLTVQWYVKIESLASEAVKAVESGKTRLIPPSWDNNYFAWMRDIKDWCISRQIWWGHRIPVWYCPDCSGKDGREQGEMIENIFFKDVTLSGKTVAGGIYSDLRKMGFSHEDILRNSKIIRVAKGVTPICRIEGVTECPVCGGHHIIYDPDVLDTWFSSSLWPFSTLGWPDITGDLKTFYPTSVLVTGFDILFFWVARMLMMGLKCMGEVPFKDVYIHALVRDAKGQKMSKSKGNVVDPLVMIGKYGADAFRFSLAAFAAQGRDVRFSEERLEGYRHFINKLWNATKFIIRNESAWKTRDPYAYGEKLDIAGKWILSRLAFTVDEVNRNLDNYRFNDAAGSIYHFIWHEFCDWYLEITKPLLYQEDSNEKTVVVDCLFFVLEQSLKLLHPFIPFVTEEIWHSVFDGESSLMLMSYPKELPRFLDAERQMEILLRAVTGIRSVRGELNITPSVEIRADIRTLSNEVKSVIENNIVSIKKLTRCKEINLGPEIRRVEGSAVSVHEGMEVYIPLSGLLDVGAEIKRLQKEVSKMDETMTFLNKKLLNEDFLKNAPKTVLEKDKAKYDDLLVKRVKLEENLKILRTI